MSDQSSVPGERAARDRWIVKESTSVVPAADLKAADSPRLGGEDAKHIRLLATIDAPLPPILVHRPTMRVIDGMHRLAATLVRGESEVAVEFFDGSESQAFVHAVETNVRHGLPLSRADREAAVRRIIVSHQDWSDRAIAAVSGLSAPTVGSIRQRLGAEVTQVDVRVGRDGRARPVSGVEGRRRASEVIKTQPDAPLRAIARAAGVSVGTARDVRERMKRGDDPVPPRIAAQRGPRQLPETSVEAAAATSATTSARSVARRGSGPGGDTAQLILHRLRMDPSLRFSETGRTLLQWLGVYMVADGRHDSFLRLLPEHCVAVVADLAWGCSELWRELAQELDERSRNIN
jgi:hypothetical protein